MRACAALAVALAFVAAGCGKHEPSRHDQVATYIASVNAIEAKLARPLLEISKANRDYAKRKGTPASIAKRLRTQADRVDALRARLAALDPPPDAVKLEQLVVELARDEASLAREVASLATFLPAFSDALRPLTRASAPLQTALKSKSQADVKASALERYAGAVAGVLQSLAKLHPPAMSSAVFDNQVRTLKSVRASALALADALRAKRAKDLPALLVRFNRAAIGNQSIAAQKAQIASVKGYDARIRRIGVLATRVHREEQRLRRLLG